MAYDTLVDSTKLNATFKGIADAIRDKTGSTELISDKEIAEQIPSVFDAGKQEGYDTFWDIFQQNGNRTDYLYGFSGIGWNRNTFMPKYDMYPTSINTGFHSLNRSDNDWETFDMVEHLANLGVVLDTSQCTNLTAAFMWMRTARLGVIDCRACNSDLNNTFAQGKIKTIDKLILKEENTFPNTFTKQAELTNITIEGTIGNSIDFQYSTKLTKASIESIINALSDTASGKTLTLSHDAVTNAFIDYQMTWVRLVGTKPNWTISLI